MRLGIVLWSFVCAWCVIHSIGFYESGNMDYAVMFGTGFMISLYLFITKTVEYIKEDYPVQMNIMVNQKESKKKRKVTDENDS